MKISTLLYLLTIPIGIIAIIANLYDIFDGNIISIIVGCTPMAIWIPAFILDHYYDK